MIATETPLVETGYAEGSLDTHGYLRGYLYYQGIHWELLAYKAHEDAPGSLTLWADHVHNSDCGSGEDAIMLGHADPEDEEPELVWVWDHAPTDVEGLQALFDEVWQDRETLTMILDTAGERFIERAWAVLECRKMYERVQG